jgi:hypothetical protein
MVASFTPNLQLTLPARGDDVGTWDTPVNGNETLIDLVAGGIATISLNNSNVVLSAAQFQSKTITFNSTLTGSLTITLPTSFTKSYEIQHLCTGSSAFTITLETTASGGQVVCAVPGEIVEVLNDGVNIKYKNFGGRIGSYMDWVGSSTPNWSDGCTIPPYLNCNAGSLSSATYPVLFGMIGGTLPDRRGTVGATLNQGTGRLSFVINASSVGVVGGVDNIALTPTQIPSITSNTNTTFGGKSIATYLSPSGESINPTGSANAVGDLAGLANISFLTAAGGTATSNNTGGAAHGNVQPTTVYGLSLIRAG